MGSIDTIPGMRGEEIKESDGKGEFSYDYIYFVNVPSVQQ
jgi:hypothetical protein